MNIHIFHQLSVRARSHTMDTCWESRWRTFFQWSAPNSDQLPTVISSQQWSAPSCIVSPKPSSLPIFFHDFLWSAPLFWNMIHGQFLAAHKKKKSQFIGIYLSIYFPFIATPTTGIKLPIQCWGWLEQQLWRFVVSQLLVILCVACHLPPGSRLPYLGRVIQGTYQADLRDTMQICFPAGAGDSMLSFEESQHVRVATTVPTLTKFLANKVKEIDAEIKTYSW